MSVKTIHHSCNSWSWCGHSDCCTSSVMSSCLSWSPVSCPRRYTLEPAPRFNYLIRNAQAIFSTNAIPKCSAKLIYLTSCQEVSQIFDVRFALCYLMEDVTCNTVFSRTGSGASVAAYLLYVVRVVPVSRIGRWSPQRVWNSLPLIIFDPVVDECHPVWVFPSVFVRIFLMVSLLVQFEEHRFASRDFITL